MTRDWADTDAVRGEPWNVDETAFYYLNLVPGPVSDLLDVGCDQGQLKIPAHFRWPGVSYCGIDPNPYGGVAEWVAPYERVPIFRASQDLVCFIHTLDHLEDPAAALAKAHKELRAGGRLLVVVHNMNAWTRHLLPTWPGTDRYHIHEFSPASLRQLAESAGFEVLWQGSTLNKYSLGYLLSWLFGIEPRGHWGPGIWVKLGNIGLVARKA